MIRHNALLLSVVLVGAGLFAGCATTTTAPNGPSSCAMPQRAQGGGVHHDRAADVASLRGGAVMRVVDPSGGWADPAGIPTPEPARPLHEPQMAGPTPQVPIPVSGGVMGLPAW